MTVHSCKDTCSTRANTCTRHWGHFWGFDQVKIVGNKLEIVFTYTKLPYSRAPSPVPLLAALLGENSFALSLSMSRSALPTSYSTLSLLSLCCCSCRPLLAFAGTEQHSVLLCTTAVVSQTSTYSSPSQLYDFVRSRCRRRCTCRRRRRRQRRRQWRRRRQRLCD